MANEAKVAAKAMGNCSLTFPPKHVLRLYKVFYFARATRNIIYVFIQYKNGYYVQFNGNGCLIYFRNSLVDKAMNTNGLYVLELNDVNFMSTITNKRSQEEINPWFGIINQAK